ncbi:MAG: phosphoribosylformylglycinamidine synthase [Clostridium sp.]
MRGWRSIFVEKKEGFNIEAKELLNDFKLVLSIGELEGVRVVNKYILDETDEEVYNNALYTVFSEKTVDKLYEGEFPIGAGETAFCVEFLPGQYDQRADSAEECFQLLTGKERVKVKSARVIVLQGNLSEEQVLKIKNYYINPVDSREVDIYDMTLTTELDEPKAVEVLNGFINMSLEELGEFHKNNSLAMSIDDLVMIKDYFNSEERDPSITEIKVIDTYWSDHCRHTTFSTVIEEVNIEEGKYTMPIIKSYNAYLKSREYVYGEKEVDRDETLMDIAVITMKEMRKSGLLDDLDVSDEINACSINVTVETIEGDEEYLLMFKNETHNHPTEIEPFGGAATCLGGAIRDPLSGRAYVYGAMRVTGSGDPTVKVQDTLKGKLPQKTITQGAAHGYSSYGNQIGLATGQVSEVYHNNYIAKRMEVGAVIASAKKENVVREEPQTGDVIVLLGGRTGRDGLGGATGSSKEHTEESINECGAEVQKGNPPTERKIQRLFRNSKVSKMIKRCNDFGAGGVSVAIGELTRGLEIDLDMVPKKYNGLDGTELAISESQERMAVVIRKEDLAEFIKLSEEENLEAVHVATVTDNERLVMFWRGDKIVDVKRSFLDTNGAKQTTTIEIKDIKDPVVATDDLDIKTKWMNTLKSLNVASQKGLSERFDSTIGTNTVLMPFGGKYAETPAEGLAMKIPVVKGKSKTASLMTFGFNPEFGMWSPYHMAYYSVIESVTKLAAMGGDYSKARLTLQEYFERLGKNPEKWGKPFSALLGAYQAQIDLKIPAIGGKDSMSGTFGDLDVPPSLVCFAVGTENADVVISPEFKKEDSKIVLLKAEKTEDMLLDMDIFKYNLKTLYSLIKDKKVISAYSLKFGGIAEGLSKMTLGNRIGAEISNVTKEEMFAVDYGTLILEVNNDVNIEKEFNGCAYKVIGNTTGNGAITSAELDLEVSIEDIKVNLEEKLAPVFKIKTNDSKEVVQVEEFKATEVLKAKVTVEKPKVVIPVFPGTNCELDCERAFEQAGAEVKEVLIRNITAEAFEESIQRLEAAIKESQIIMLPGGFSAGDEPDGSAKFITVIFRNERIKNAVADLLNNRDGLMIGICNGFQALIKLGLLPYGEIRDIEEDMATLSFNEINRHMSSMVKTKVVSNKSPWLAGMKAGDVVNVPISHGEGRFVAPESLLKELEANGQIATQYVDLEGNASMNMPYNPNGSAFAIEGITSLDGRIIGKMGHSERIGENLYKNVPGEFDLKLFESGVNYFKS